MTSLLNGQAVKVLFGSTSVTSRAGLSFFSQRAQVAPPKPPPTTTTLAAPSAETTDGAKAAPAASFRKVRLLAMADYLPCAPSHWAMASISASSKPLAMRPITVAGRAPLLNSRMRLAVSAPEAARRHQRGLDPGHLVNAHDVVAVEVGLLDRAVLDRDLAVERRREPVGERARDLPLDLRRVDGVARVGPGSDLVDLHH